MGKKKDTQEEVINNDVIITPTETEKSYCNKLYKYEIGDTVFVMENNQVKEFVIAKRVILTVEGNDNQMINEIYYDETNVRSLRGSYKEEQLYPTKKALLASL